MTSSLSRRRFLRGAGAALAVFVAAAAFSWQLSVRAAEPAGAVGTLVAIGGGAEQPELMRDVLDLARGPASRIVILNTASSDPGRSAAAYQRFFQGLGASAVRVLPLLDRAQAYETSAVEAIAQADLIYFTGGNQLRLGQILQDSPVHGALIGAWNRGAVIAGTSAGAMVWGSQFLASGSSETALALGALELKPGFGLLPEVLVDTHFDRENRLGRLLVAASRQSGVLGVGVDEQTAAVLTGEGVRVLGSGRVTVLDFARATQPSAPKATFAIRDVSAHRLGAGDVLRWHRDEAERTPMLAGRERAAFSAPSLYVQGGEAPADQAPFPLVGGKWPEPVAILAPAGQAASAARWRAQLNAAGCAQVRVVAARPGAIEKGLEGARAVLILDSAQSELARALTGEDVASLKQRLAQLPVAAAGAAAPLLGEASVKPGGAAADLLPGLGLASGIVTSPQLWAPGAFDRLVLDALLADGALGVGLTGGNAVRLANGTLEASGSAPVFVIDTGRVSLANPAVPSARDLVLHVLAPGETLSLK